MSKTKKSIQTGKKLIISIFPPVIVYAVNLILANGFRQNYYDVYSWLDIPVHFAGGMSIALFFHLLLNTYPQEKKIINKFSPILQIISSVFFVCFIAVIWEFYEFIVDYIFGTINQAGVSDTMGDLFFGVLGGFVVASYLAVRRENAKKKEKL